MRCMKSIEVRLQAARLRLSVLEIPFFMIGLIQAFLWLPLDFDGSAIILKTEPS